MESGSEEDGDGQLEGEEEEVGGVGVGEEGHDYSADSERGWDGEGDNAEMGGVDCEREFDGVEPEIQGCEEREEGEETIPFCDDESENDVAALVPESECFCTLLLGVPDFCWFFGEREGGSKDILEAGVCGEVGIRKELGIGEFCWREVGVDALYRRRLVGVFGKHVHTSASFFSLIEEILLGFGGCFPERRLIGRIAEPMCWADDVCR